MQNRVIFPLPDDVLDGGAGSSARFAYVDRFVPLSIALSDNKVLQSAAYQAWLAHAPATRASASSTSRPGEDVEAAGRASDFGVIFKERTRIDPAGFVLGEHLISLSLAPGEEVTIEQKAFSERQVTYEEVTDTTRELDTELSATFTTELSKQLQDQLSETRQTSFEIGGEIGGNIKGVDISVSPKWTNSLTNADTTTRSESVRQSANHSHKVAAKFRTQHKITMQISETSRFEATTKRVLRNPNTYTPIDLVYFKVMQRLRLSQERYGARLCWAPFIADPGVIADAAMNQARTYFSQLYALEAISPEPVRPKEPGSTTYVQELGWPELDQWGFWGDMRYDDYIYTLQPQTGYQWDGDEAFVKASIEFRTQSWGARGTPSVYVISAGSDGAGGVRIRIHGGANVGGPGASLYANAKARFKTAAGTSDPAYETAFAAWKTAHAEWEQEKQAAEVARAAKIEAAMSDWRNQYWKNFDPAMSAMQLLVRELFATHMRDESWEVDAWNTLFEFESAAMKLYPAWWSDRPTRDPSVGPNSFQNASWARVFLPIRTGYEREALTWLVERRLFTPAIQPATRDGIDKIMREFETYRSQHFGGPEEFKLTTDSQPYADLTQPFLCLGTWEETIPTDGTHLEVLQASTTATDAELLAQLKDADALRNKQIDRMSSENALRQAALSRGVGSVATEIKIHIGEEEES